jgi:hypothetical protein
MTASGSTAEAETVTSHPHGDHTANVLPALPATGEELSEMPPCQLIAVARPAVTPYSKSVDFAVYEYGMPLTVTVAVQPANPSPEKVQSFII